MLLWMRDAHPELDDDRHLERDLQHAHDRGQRGPRLRGLPARCGDAADAFERRTYSGEAMTRPACLSRAPGRPLPSRPRLSWPPGGRLLRVGGGSGDARAVGTSDAPRRVPGRRPPAPTSPTTTPAPEPAKAPADRHLPAPRLRGDLPLLQRRPDRRLHRRPHTAYTFAVKTIPADVSVPGVSIGNKSIQDAASSSCRDAFAGFIGGDPGGACAVAAQRDVLPARAARLQPRRALGALRRGGAQDLQRAGRAARQARGLPRRPGCAARRTALCSTGDPGAAASRLVMCAENARLPGQGGAPSRRPRAPPIPGQAAAGPDGQQRCTTYPHRPAGDVGRLHLRLDLSDRHRLGRPVSGSATASSRPPSSPPFRDGDRAVRSRGAGAASGRAASPWRP